MNKSPKLIDLGACLLLCVAPAALAQPIIPGMVSSKLDPELKGHVLIEELNCAACQQSKAPLAGHSQKAPRLSSVGSRVNPAYLGAFIRDPHATKPGTTMPDMLAMLGKDKRDETAKALTHFLLSLKKNDFSPQAPDAVAADHGKELFHSRGCVACHSPRDEDGVELLPGKSAPLGALEKKYSVKSLIKFLQRPHASRPTVSYPHLRAHATQANLVCCLLLEKLNQKVD